YGDVAVAEHTMALIFACCRDLARMDRAVRAGVWDPLESMQLNGKTLGLIGLGGIGREVARIARGIGMEVIAWNRSPRPDAGVPLVALDDLLARADVISLHAAADLRQYAVLLPGDHQRNRKFSTAVAARFPFRSGAGGSVPPERSGDGRRPSRVRQRGEPLGCRRRLARPAARRWHRDRRGQQR